MHIKVTEEQSGGGCYAPGAGVYTTMPGFFVVDAVATSGDNQQNVRMAVAQEDVVAPWWDFVLFVEGFTP